MSFFYSMVLTTQKRKTIKGFIIKTEIVLSFI